MPIAQLPELRTNYLWTGSAAAGGPPLVLVHGLAASLAFWLPLSQHLGADHRLLMYDLRGHGRSGMTPTGYAPAALAGDLLALLDHLQVERAVLVAHSFGGAVALEFALRHPRRTRSLVVSSAVASADAEIRARTIEFRSRIVPASVVHGDDLKRRKPPGKELPDLSDIRVDILPLVEAGNDHGNTSRIWHRRSLPYMCQCTVFSPQSEV